MNADSPACLLLRRHPLFSGLTDEQFRQLSGGMHLRQVGKGDFLFHRGDPAAHFYFVVAGQIQLGMFSPDGVRVKVIEVIDAGHTFAEAIAFMRAPAYPVSASALTASELVRISNRDYVELLQTSSAACLRLLGDLSARLHGLVREIEHLTVQNAHERLAGFLLDRIRDTPDNAATVQLEYPRHVVASRLAIKPETLSRLLREMIEKGVISVDEQTVHVHDIAALRPHPEGVYSARSLPS